MSVNFGLSIGSVLILLQINAFIDAIPNPRRQMPKECKGQNFCSISSHDYPYEKIDKIVSRMQTYGFRNYDERAKYIEDVVQDCPYNEQDRNCCTSTRWTTPYQILNDDTIKVVVQSAIFQQIIKEVRCVNENNDCFKYLGLYKFRTSCKTDYAETNMYVINSVDNHGEWAKTRIPVGCSCHIEKNYEK